MKVYYFNDENKNVIVQVNGQPVASTEHPYGLPNIEYFMLLPQQGALFEFDAPENAVPWVKHWDGKVLLSYIPVEALDHLQPPSQKL